MFRLYNRFFLFIIRFGGLFFVHRFKAIVAIKVVANLMTFPKVKRFYRNIFAAFFAFHFFRIFYHKLYSLKNFQLIFTFNIITQPYIKVNKITSKNKFFTFIRYLKPSILQYSYHRLTQVFCKNPTK